MLLLQTIRQFVQAHPRRVAVIVVAVIIYAGLNVWVFRYATSGRASSPSASLRVDTDKSLAPGAREVKPSPTPTPRPTGPGDYACDPYGQCNLYSDEMRKQYCTVTFADSLCLDQCGDKAKQCAK